METHVIGLPVVVTVDDDGLVTFTVDVTEASVEKNYDEDVSDAFLNYVEDAIQNGDYSTG